MGKVDWTTARVADLRRLLDEGFSYREVAEKLGLGRAGRNAVLGTALRLGLCSKNQQSRNKGAVWTAPMINQLRELWKAGNGEVSIARKLGLNTLTVRRKAYKLGLRAADRGTKPSGFRNIIAGEVAATTKGNAFRKSAKPCETVEDFLRHGGQIQVCPPAYAVSSEASQMRPKGYFG